MKHATAAAAVALALSSPAWADWTYVFDRDPMTDKPISVADLESNASLSLASPYAGRNYARLRVVQRGAKTLVLFNIDQGQILCRTNECSVQVRFDDLPAKTYSGSPPSDLSSQTVFVNAAADFIARARQAKKIRVRFLVYQNGNQDVEFFTSSQLKWPRAGKTPA